MNVPDEHISEVATYEADYEEWVESNCKKAAEIVARLEEKEQETK